MTEVSFPQPYLQDAINELRDKQRRKTMQLDSVTGRLHLIIADLEHWGKLFNQHETTLDVTIVQNAASFTTQLHQYLRELDRWLSQREPVAPWKTLRNELKQAVDTNWNQEKRALITTYSRWATSKPVPAISEPAPASAITQVEFDTIRLQFGDCLLDFKDTLEDVLAIVEPPETT